MRGLLLCDAVYFDRQLLTFLKNDLPLINHNTQWSHIPDHGNPNLTVA